jgi:hypothetical protein
MCMCGALTYVHTHSNNSPDAEVEEVKCINSVMDEVIPDGIGSSQSDSDDGEIHVAIVTISCTVTVYTISHYLYCTEQHINDANDDKYHFLLAPDFSSKPKEVPVFDYNVIIVPPCETIALTLNLDK